MTQREHHDLLLLDTAALVATFNGKHDLLLRMSRELLDQFSGYEATLARALSDGNHEGIEHVAHSLAGSAAIMGARRLSAVAMDLEQDLLHQRPTDLESRVRGLVRELHAAAAALEAFLETLPGN